MSELKLKGVNVVDTFAEAFPMVGTRIIITAPTLEWALIAARTMTGFATSVIAAGAEAGAHSAPSASRAATGAPRARRQALSAHFRRTRRSMGGQAWRC